MDDRGLVHAELDLARLDLLTALPTSIVTVPAFGFGIRPFGPSTFRSLPTSRIMSGVATSASNSMEPSWIFATEVLGARRDRLPRPALPWPCRPTRSPRRAWTCPCRAAGRPCRGPSGRRASGSTPSSMAMSTDSSNFAYSDVADELHGLRRARRACSRPCAFARREFLTGFSHRPPSSFKRRRSRSASDLRQARTADSSLSQLPTS